MFPHGYFFVHKRVILTLVNRQGEARSFHVEKSNTANVMPIVRENLSMEAIAMTDESRIYDQLADHEDGHFTVNHARGEYVSDARDARLEEIGQKIHPIRSKATSRSSNAACVACTSTALRSIYIAILPSSISATRIVRPSAWKMNAGRPSC